MKCEYCDDSFTSEATIKVIKGKKHIFCCEMCYRFYHYRVPKHDMNVEGPGTVRIHGVPDFRVLIQEDEQKG